MTTELERFAQRLEGDEFFLANVLNVYAESEGLDDEQLAQSLGCDLRILLRLRLCRAPSNDADFQRDVEIIAERLGVDHFALAEAVRRGQVVSRLRISMGGQRGYLMAARDGEKPADDAEGGAT